MRLPRAERLARIVLNAADPVRLADFYAAAFGFARSEREGDETLVPLALGPSRIDLRLTTGRPYPVDVAGWSPLFQHCAIVVRDMDAAMRRLDAVQGWAPISTDGPVRLPANTGGVTAFKFRDPEGHPLELLAFPSESLPERWRIVTAAGPCLGVDHSAISVTNTARSIAFYERLGLAVSGSSHNVGHEQDRLDAIADASVDVTALQPPTPGPPHVELLAYRGAFDRDTDPMDIHDVAASQLVFATSDAPVVLRDPDGHILRFEPSA
jgi:catechol 2,3-dioxygenase-like lactoylglutathione lyase family enzyme